MESEPDAFLLPAVQAPPTGHAAAAAHFPGEILPGNAGLEDEEDAGQGLAVADGFASRVTKAAGLGGQQQGLDEVPQGIGEEWLGHDDTSSGRGAVQEDFDANGVPDKTIVLGPLMNMPFQPVAVPLFDDGQGSLRVTGTRVLLERVVHAIEDGATPEGIVQSYGTLQLADVYAVLPRDVTKADVPIGSEVWSVE